MLLPKLGGPDVLRALRMNPLTSSIPVVVLSSLPQKNAARLLREGATAYFDKSTLGLEQGSESLIRIVKQILDGGPDQRDDIEISDVGIRPVARGGEA
jgi:CheY-like chemotaxis protein